MTRQEVLEEAKRTVSKERVSDYGTPEDSFSKIAKLWSCYLSKEILPSDVAYMMVLLKIARTLGGSDKLDNAIDIAGYAACAGELISNKGKAELLPMQQFNNFKLRDTATAQDAPKVTLNSRESEEQDGWHAR